MSLEAWLDKGIIESHTTSDEDLGSLIVAIDQIIEDISRAKDAGMSKYARFTLAFDAIKLCAKLLLAVAGYRIRGSEASNFRLIQSLRLTIKPDAATMETLDKFRRRRNIVVYNQPGSLTEHESAEIIEQAKLLYDRTIAWIQEKKESIPPREER